MTSMTGASGSSTTSGKARAGGSGGLSSLSPAAIVALAVGGGAALGLVAVGLAFLLARLKRPASAPPSTPTADDLDQPLVISAPRVSSPYESMILGKPGERRGAGGGGGGRALRGVNISSPLNLELALRGALPQRTWSEAVQQQQQDGAPERTWSEVVEQERADSGYFQDRFYKRPYSSRWTQGY